VARSPEPGGRAARTGSREGEGERRAGGARELTDDVKSIVKEAKLFAGVIDVGRIWMPYHVTSFIVRPQKGNTEDSLNDVMYSQFELR
jgi:hypothetical protein